ncbi:hypothetical protein CO2235_150152 [Cupriavidus oxalaticus]|uniref:Uncharacterized protein n=1 Tax=Cupriavidus oxalaticus TaxID=96344 RepID=A0A375FLF1_9BURK|nr:hypothetical protein CO2235_U590093 [Cupriavidus oxalaticus]SPC12497.1 hypothetical protein CO2235_150152 [Cupriavidus oxalaticus]
MPVRCATPILANEGRKCGGKASAVFVASYGMQEWMGEPAWPALHCLCQSHDERIGDGHDVTDGVRAELEAMDEILRNEEHSSAFHVALLSIQVELRDASLQIENLQQTSVLVRLDVPVVKSAPCLNRLAMHHIRHGPDLLFAVEHVDGDARAFHVPPPFPILAAVSRRR